MDVYIYQADLYCKDCGREICVDLRRESRAPKDPDDESSYDSGDYPKGPYPDGGGEADSPHHCGACEAFLENALTGDGWEGLCDMIIDYLAGQGGREEIIKEWIDFYDVSLSNLLEYASEKAKK